MCEDRQCQVQGVYWTSWKTNFLFVVISEKLNAILKTGVNTLDMSEFDQMMTQLLPVASQLSVEASRQDARVPVLHTVHTAQAQEEDNCSEET